MSGTEQSGKPDVRLEQPSWTNRVLTAECLARLLDGQAELVVAEKTIVTPLAADELKRRGITLVRRRAETAAEKSESRAIWSVVMERADSMISSVMVSLDRERLSIRLSSLTSQPDTARWAMAAANEVVSGKSKGIVAITQNPCLCCCIANKLAGIRAVAVASAVQATQALKTIGANLLALDSAGRTFFELRQILRTAALSGQAGCPAELASVLQELDGHAHR
jgi:ribose 5-phosphate isomerase RpiB